MELGLDAGSWWSYALVFLAAARPAVEVLVVIPAAVLAGMPPVPTTLLALAGNLSTVVVVALAGDKVIAWRRRRQPQWAEKGNRRAQRAGQLARRWGVPGLALLAPLTTGTHIATLAALATGAATRRVLQWMIAGLAVWAVTAVVATVAGMEVFR